jgi:putative peptidoglycan lipid II flippase
LIGGILQFLYLYRAVLNFYRPRIILPVLNEKLKKFFKLFLPGVVGSGVIQLNIVIGTIIASFLPVGAISHIYYADRLNQLPLAIFGIALGIVLLPSLSKAIKQSDHETTNNIQNRSIEFSLLISLPSAIGLFILAEPIIQILFERGAFVAEDTLYTAKVLSNFALGLPAYIIIKVLVSCFFAREDTKTPLYISIVSVITNVVLSLLLIGSMREMGIALATAISAWINALLLYVFLYTRNLIQFDDILVKNSFKIFINSTILFGAIYVLNGALFNNIIENSVLVNSGLLLLMIFLAIIIYFALVIVLKVLTINQLREYLKK